MLRINCKKAYYTFDNDINDKAIIIKPILYPKLTQPDIFTFQQWKERYTRDIEDITEKFLSMIMMLTSDNYVCHINVGKLKKDFVRKLYITSFNRVKKYT